MIEIDGSQGEGGGQVLRTSLALSLLTQQPFRIERIRAGRDQPGLRPQHLECVRAAMRISRAAVTGDRVGSQSLVFSPGPVVPGAYEFHIGTAGAVTLVVQTVLLPLLRARGLSLLTVTGGTHVPWSPTVDYLEHVFLRSLEATGYPRVAVEVPFAGYYPKGGGEVKLALPEWDSGGLTPLRRETRGTVARVRAISATSSLPQHVSDRQSGRAETRLRGMDLPHEVERRVYASRQPGTSVLLVAETDGGPMGATALGSRGKPAERVADEACDELERTLSREGAVDLHLADQLLLPLALVDGESSFTATEVTLHLLTVVDVVRAFHPVEIVVDGREGEPGRVVIRGRSLR